MSKKIKIAIVDDEHLIRSAISMIINQEEDMMVCHSASNGDELLKYLNSTQDLPDIILMDIRMDGLNGTDTTKIVTEKYPRIRIIMLTSLHSNQIIEQMILYGVCGYLIKNTDPETMLFTIRTVHEMGLYFDPEIMKLIVNMRNRKPEDRIYADLSEREVEILNLLAQQNNTKEIAEMLFLSERTVEGHRKRMLEKTNSKNVVGLIVWGIRNHVIMLD